MDICGIHLALNKSCRMIGIVMEKVEMVQQAQIVNRKAVLVPMVQTLVVEQTLGGSQIHQVHEIDQPRQPQVTAIWTPQ